MVVITEWRRHLSVTPTFVTRLAIATHRDNNFASQPRQGFISTVPGVEAGTVKDKKDRDLATLA